MRSETAAASRSLADAWCWSSLGAECLRETRRILNSREDAEEAAQEALIRAWRQRVSCERPEAPGAWVAQIARHEALRLLVRERARRQTHGIVQRLAHPVNHAESDAIIERLDLQTALEDLSVEDRALIALRYQVGVSQAQLADALSVPHSSVRVRLHRIRKRLERRVGRVV